MPKKGTIDTAKSVEETKTELFQLASLKIKLAEQKKAVEAEEKKITEKIFSLALSSNLIDDKKTENSDLIVSQNGVDILIQSQYASPSLLIQENAVEYLKSKVPSERLKTLVYTKEILHEGSLDILVNEGLLSEKDLSVLIEQKANSRKRIIKLYVNSKNKE